MSIGYTFPPGPDVGDAGAGMALVMRAKAVPFEVREHAALAELSHAAADFTAKLRSGEIEPIITPIEEDPNAAMDPAAFLGQLQSNPYLSQVFLTLQNLGECGDADAEAMAPELFQTGGAASQWAVVENFLPATPSTSSSTTNTSRSPFGVPRGSLAANRLQARAGAS